MNAKADYDIQSHLDAASRAVRSSQAPHGVVEAVTELVKAIEAVQKGEKK